MSIVPVLPPSFYQLPVCPITRVNPAQRYTPSLLGPIPDFRTGKVKPAVILEIRCREIYEIY